MTWISQNFLLISFNTLAVYVFLCLSIRAFGKRQLGQLSALDLMIIILLGSAVETSMVHGDTSLKAGFVSGTTLFVANYLVSRWVRRSKKFGRFCGTGPVLLVHDGAFVEEHLKRSGLTQEDVLHAIREREHADLSDVRFAVLEPDGEINVVSRS
jgi:uncharacterized membrane protein YcaP (DUF421 family)